MDSALKCNDLKCRCCCSDQAVVTTCSHIFCLPCAARLRLTEPPHDGYRECPACGTQLLNPDDAVITSLTPSEDYKTSILSGLSPAIIMECAGRGLAFWAYQMVQEITFQDFMARSLTERYQALESNMAETERLLKEDNDKLNSTLKATRADHQELLNKNERLQQVNQQKTKSFDRVHALYNKLKHLQQAAGLEMAADQGADEILMQAGTQQQQPLHRPAGQMQPRARNGSNGSGRGDEHRLQRVHSWPHSNQPSYPQQNTRSTSYQAGGGRSYRPAVGSSHSLPIPPASSQSRVRLPQIYSRPAYGSYNESLLGGTMGAGMGNDGLRAVTPLPTQHAGAANAPGHSPNSGYGMSAGMRVGRPGGSTVPLGRSGLMSNRPGGGYVGMAIR